MSSNIERSKGTVRFAFKESESVLSQNKSKPYLLYLWFTYGGQRFKYSTGYKITYGDWDARKQRVRNKVGVNNKDEINSYLSRIEEYIKNDYSQISTEYSNISPRVLKDRLDLFTKKVAPSDVSNQELSFFEVIDKYLLERSNIIKPVTKRSYVQTKKKLMEYEKYCGKTLSFESIDMIFYNQFNEFMEEKGYALNTIGKHTKNMITFFNYAVIEGYTTNQKFKRSDFKVKKEITTEIYLNEDEIRAFYDIDLTRFPELSHARDVFLMGCYTGQRISDYNNLNTRDIVSNNGVQFFRIRQQKNHKHGRVVNCPITKDMRYIMDTRHRGNPPIAMNEQLINDYIKQIGQMLGFDEMIKCEITKGGEHLIQMIPKYKLIKAHTARRSFCTNKYLAGMSIYDIMLFSGHSTEKEFYKYIRIKDDERANHLVNSGFFNI